MITRIKQILSGNFGSVSFFDSVASSLSTGPITQDCFTPITPTSNEFTYIDGGQNSLYVSPSFALYMIRVASVCAKKSEILEYVLVLYVKEQTIHCEFLPINDAPAQETIAVSLTDAYVVNTRLPIVGVAGLARRLVEISVANSSTHSVLDGSLQTKHDFEKIKSHVIGVSKTSSLLTTSGKTLTSYLRLLQSGSWLASGFMKSTFHIGFGALHPQTKYVVRIDSHSDLQTVANALAVDATDPIFLGYPYGLVKADSLARISEKEIEYWRTRIMQQFDSLTKQQLEQMAASVDSHSILDSIKF